MSRCSPAQRVLGTPELLSHIFEHSTTKDNASNALVSKTWCNEALSVLWREVTQLCNLLALLAPLHWGPNGTYVFSRHLEPQDWDRFHKYSCRVHHLSELNWPSYIKTIFIQIACTRPPQHLLPNLRTVNFGAPLFVPLFAHSKIREFHLSIDSGGDQLQKILPYISSRMPYLETLHVYLYCPCEDFESALAKCLRDLPLLKHLYLPERWLTPSIPHAVASHTMLASINSKFSAFEPALETEVFSTTLGVDSFPSLKQLELVIPFSRAVLCLSQAYEPNSLVTLRLESPRVELSATYARIIEIASNCPKLETFSLWASKRKDQHVAGSILPVNFAMLKPILRCSYLKSLTLHHALPFQLYPEDIVSLAKALPSLKVLFLNHHTKSPAGPILNISLLTALAILLPKLEKLGLYVAAWPEILPSGHIPIFQNLQFLEMGLSTIRDPVAISMFLSRILPDECCITARPGRGMDDPVYRGWGQVARLFPAFKQARNEGRLSMCNS